VQLVGLSLVKHLLTMQTTLQFGTVCDLSPTVLIVLLAVAAVVRFCASSSVLRATGSKHAQVRGR
jgi:hypothetical protein